MLICWTDWPITQLTFSFACCCLISASDYFEIAKSPHILFYCSIWPLKPEKESLILKKKNKVTASKKAKRSTRIVQSPHGMTKKRITLEYGNSYYSKDVLSHDWVEYHQSKYVFMGHMKTLNLFILSYLGNATVYARHASNTCSGSREKAEEMEIF